jgi:hypothetical protein
MLVQPGKGLLNLDWKLKLKASSPLAVDQAERITTLRMTVEVQQAWLREWDRDHGGQEWMEGPNRPTAMERRRTC